MVKQAAPRWGKKQNEALDKGIREGLFDATKTDNPYINGVYDSLDETSPLRIVTQERFRKHFREKCGIYLTAQAMTGRRRSELGPSVYLCTLFLFSHVIFCLSFK